MYLPNKCNLFFQNVQDENVWEWSTKETTDTSKKENDHISKLKKRIVELENEKSDLEHSLEQLDVDCQQSIDKLVTLKDNLQEDYNKLEDELTYLKEENKKVLNADKKKSKELQSVSAECDLLRKRIEELQISSSKQSECPTEYGKLQKENNKLLEQIESLKRIKENLEGSYHSLENAFEIYKNNNELVVKEQQSNAELRQKLSEQNDELQQELSKKHQQVEDLTKENCSLQNAVSDLNIKLDSCRNEFEKNLIEYNNMKSNFNTVTSENKALIEIKNTFEEYKQQNETNRVNSVSSEDYNRVLSELEKCKNKISSLNHQFCDLKAENSQLTKVQDDSHDELLSLKKDLLETKKCLSEVEIEKKEMHAKYINVLADSMKKYVDGIVSTEFSPILTEKDPNISEYKNQVENILKLLLDFKLKTETVEKELYELREEKARIVSEKNHDIEKLLQNSEILSQEVITKSQTIKDLEMECAELIKNNDLLISELDTYKNNSGLQTISESNEDNMVLLEAQLENANKRIKDLELTLADLEKQDSNFETNAELDYIKRQLNITGTELNQTKLEYMELLKKYEKLEDAQDALKGKCINLEALLVQSNQEKEELNASVERITSEFENNEYKCTELNIMQDSLQEDVEKYKKNYESMVEVNKKMEALNVEHVYKIEQLQSEIENYQQKLANEKEARSQIEVQLRNSVEKLQNAKMIETSLKLQIDTLYKELQNLQDIKQSLEVNFQQVLSDASTYQNSIKELQEKNESLQSVISHFQNLKVSDDELISKNAELLKRLEISEENLKNLQDRFQNISINNNTSQSDIALALQHMESDSVQKNIDILQQLQLNDKNTAGIEKTGEVLQKMDTSDSASLTTSKEFFTTTFNENLIQKLKDSYEKAIVELRNENLKIPMLQTQINELNLARNELIAVVTAKHQENITYHDEIQRLTQLLSEEKERSQLQIDSATKSEELRKKNEEIEKLTDQNNFLREKCEILAKNLLEEQSNTQAILSERSTPSDREQAMVKELERLRAHLVEIEEMYTQELLQAEQNKQEMLAKMNELEEREKNSSTLYTSVNIRANQQVESLQTQVQLLTNQRDELRKKISDAEDENSKQAASLANLQFVLEQFQKGKCLEVTVYMVSNDVLCMQ